MTLMAIAAIATLLGLLEFRATALALHDSDEPGTQTFADWFVRTAMIVAFIINYFWIWRSFVGPGALVLLAVLLFSAQMLLSRSRLHLWQPVRPLAVAAATAI